MSAKALRARGFTSSREAAPPGISRPEFNESNRFFNPAVQINNSYRVIARDRFVASPTEYYIRVWDGATVNSFDLVAKVDAFTTDHYLSYLTYASLSNTNGAAWTGLYDTGEYQLLSYLGNTSYSAGNLVRPMIADNGSIVCQFRAPNLAIKLYNSSFTDIKTIAGSSNGFTELGIMPGISDDGSAVAFAGDRGKGRGIYLAVHINQTYEIIRVAGENQDPDGPFPDLGYDAVSSQIIYFSDLVLDSRVGVIQVPSRGGYAEGPTYLVSFIGTPNLESPNDYFTNAAGLFVTPVVTRFMSTAPYVRLYTQFPMAAMQAGDSLGGASVSDFNFNDPIARVSTLANGNARDEWRHDHRIAALTGGTAIVRGTHKERLSVYPFSQCASAWRNIVYANYTAQNCHDECQLCPCRLCAKACAMTCACIALRYLGISTLPDIFDSPNNPGNFNSYMKDIHAYTGRGNMEWHLIPRGFANWPIQFIGQNLCSTTSASATRGFIDQTLKSGYPVIVATEFSWNARRRCYVPGHFVVVTGKDDTGDYWIEDPGYLDVHKLSHYGDFATARFETRGYFAPPFGSGSPRRASQPSALTSALTSAQTSTQTSALADGASTAVLGAAGISLTASDPIDLMIISPSGLRAGYDSSGTTGTLISEIPGSVVFVDGEGEVTDSGILPAKEPVFYVHIPNPENGAYQVVLTGQTDAPYTLDMDVDAGAGGAIQPPTQRTGHLDPGQTEEFGIIFPPPPPTTPSGAGWLIQ